MLRCLEQLIQGTFCKASTSMMSELTFMLSSAFGLTSIGSKALFLRVVTISYTNLVSTTPPPLLIPLTVTFNAVPCKTNLSINRRYFKRYLTTLNSWYHYQKSWSAVMESPHPNEVLLISGICLCYGLTRLLSYRHLATVLGISFIIWRYL